MASVPDVCKVPAPPAPPIPTPFPNMAQCPTANPATCSLKVKILNMAVLTKNTIMPMTTGDEGGVAGGLISGVFAQQAGYVMGNPMVVVEGSPIARSMAPTQHNGASPNSPVGMHSVPSQAAVLA
jgi:hypothetical protein